MIKKKRTIDDAVACVPWPYPKDFLKSMKGGHQWEQWCEKYCQGPFTAADMGLYFYNANDFFYFKMVWL